MSTDINISYSTVFHLEHIINNIYADKATLWNILMLRSTKKFKISTRQYTDFALKLQISIFMSENINLWGIWSQKLIVISGTATAINKKNQ